MCIRDIFWDYLVLSSTRILLPLSLVVGFILITQGTPMGFDGKMEVTTLEGVEQTSSQGAAAAVVPIKQLGTNGLSLIHILTKTMTYEKNQLR